MDLKPGSLEHRKFRNSETGSEFSIFDIQKMISACQDHPAKLTDWELNFVDDIDEYFDHHKYLSEKQVMLLEKI